MTSANNARIERDVTVTSVQRTRPRTCRK